MTRTKWALATGTAFMLLAGCDDVQRTAETEPPAETAETDSERQPEVVDGPAETEGTGIADRVEEAIGDAVDTTREAAESAGTAIREGVRELDSEDAADLLRRGGEAIGTAGERVGEFAEGLAARIEGADPSQLTVASSQERGQYVADGAGRALYMFEADQRGEDETAQSTCTGECAEAWPPLIVDDAPTAGDEIQADLVGTVERSDGALHVTYGGWPLYYYARDEEAGQTTGHDVEGFGAEWYLLAPSGEAIQD